MICLAKPSPAPGARSSPTRSAWKKGSNTLSLSPGKRPSPWSYTLEEQVRRVAAHAHKDLAPAWSELDGVVDEFGERLPQLAVVAPPLLEGLALYVEVDAARSSLEPLFLQHGLEQRLQVERLTVHGVPAALERGEVDQVVERAR